MKRLLTVFCGIFCVQLIAAETLEKQALLPSRDVVSSLDDLIRILEQTQDFIQPISPPGSDVFIAREKVPHPVDWSGFSKKVTKYMTAYMDEYGLPRYELLIWEDVKTRDRVVSLASTGFEVARVPAEVDYKPEAFYQKNLLRGAAYSDAMRWIFDPAHTAVSVELMPESLYAAYEQNEAANASLMMQTGPPPPDGSSGGTGEVVQAIASISNNLVRMTVDSNSVVTMTIKVPADFGGNYIELFQRNHLQWYDWEMAAEWLPTFGNTHVSWQDPGSSNWNSRFYVISDADADTDGDGYSDLRETMIEPGGNPTNFNYVNVDQDDLHDWWERKIFGTLDYDGEDDPDGDGLKNNEELIFSAGTTAPPTLRSDPSLLDSDNDGMDDWFEVLNLLAPMVNDADVDRDSDGLSNYCEYTNGLDVSNWDTDGDTLPDGFEFYWGTDPAVSNNILADTDGDDLSLLDEYQYGTDPTKNDTDGDGYLDGFEVSQGSNPTDSTDEGIAPATNQLVNLTFKVGDHSSSASEIYEMVLTGPTSTNRLRAPDYGELITKTFQVKTGASYNIAVNHAGSSRTDPEYDYTAQVTYDTSAPVILDDPESILGVKGTAGTFDDTFGALNKTATVHVVKATFEAQPDMINFGFDPTGAEPWASVISGSENPVAQAVLSPFCEGIQADLLVSNESFLSIDTSSCTTKTNTFTLTGVAKGEAAVEVKKDGLKFGKLNVHVFEKQSLSVGIYRVYDSRSHSSNAVAGASASLIQSTMNSVFKQCGIEFNVSDYGCTNIWYDDNLNGVCERWFDTNEYRIDEMDFLPDLNCSEDINFIYLNESGYPYDEANPGFMIRGTELNSGFAGYRGAVLFLNGPDGLGSGDLCAMAAAHEAGHVLGIAYAYSDSEGHDTGPVPEGSSALMKSGAPVDGVLPTSIDGWIRQEDWKEANRVAKEEI